jgi:hypothetical protein
VHFCDASSLLWECMWSRRIFNLMIARRYAKGDLGKPFHKPFQILSRSAHWRFSVNPEFLPATSVFQRTYLRFREVHAIPGLKVETWCTRPFEA